MWGEMVGIGSCYWGEEVRGMVLVALIEGTSSERLVELLATENDFLVPFFCRTCE